MEEAKEKNKPEKLKLMRKSPDWLNLPNPIATNIILEYLDIVDYIRFPAVCKDWQLIQREHRIRYSPCTPPLSLSSPWLICDGEVHMDDIMDESNCFYLPKEQKFFNIPVYNAFVIKINCNHGWFLLLEFSRLNNLLLRIFNPITGYLIQLPPLSGSFRDFMDNFCTGFISLPPADTKCTIFMMYRNGKVHLCPLHGIMVWKTFDFSKKYFYTTVLFNEKIYTMASKYQDGIYVIDTLLSKPTEYQITMDCSYVCSPLRFHLVEFLGELVMVILAERRGFDVYKADFSKNKWVKMETLGDHAFFVDSSHIFSSPATDVGCKKNTIYFKDHFGNNGITWMSFDLDTRNWTHGQHIAFPRNQNHCRGDWHWFIPTLEHLNAGKTINRRIPSCSNNKKQF